MRKDLQSADIVSISGHSFRRSSASILANSGESIETVKNLGGWSSSKVAEGYIENSFKYKIRTGDTISSAITGTNGQQSTADGSSVRKRKVETITAPASDGIVVTSQQSVSYAAVYETRKVETTSTSTVQSLADHDSIEMEPHTITASQGYAASADDTIEDSLLATLDDKHIEESRQPFQGQIQEKLGGMSFAHCTVTINFNK